MRNLRWPLSLLLAAVMVLAMNISAFAAVSDTGFSDVAAGVWYADAVQYVRSTGLMSGTDSTTFSPNATASRAMLATILYRAAGSPAVGSHSFTDIPAGIWYETAAAWADERGIMSGYGGGLFGGDDPVTREQLVTIFWRYAGAPDAAAGTDFADETSISSYAAQAADWARTNRIINGKDGNLFDPKDTATRAEAAAILHNYMTTNPQTPQQPTPETPTPAPEPTPEPDPEPTPEHKTLVAYFSATNTTERVAQTIANTLNADLFELEPVNPYTSSDLNYSNTSSRVCREHDDPSLQNIELVSSAPSNWDEYDTVFIGYPIWWHAAAWPVNGFITGNDFTGKTVVPFCTSASSGLEGSDTKLKDMAGTGNWLSGRNFFSRDSEETIAAWVNSLGLS